MCIPMRFRVERVEGRKTSRGSNFSTRASGSRGEKRCHLKLLNYEMKDYVLTKTNNNSTEKKEKKRGRSVPLFSLALDLVRMLD